MTGHPRVAAGPARDPVRVRVPPALPVRDGRGARWTSRSWSSQQPGATGRPARRRAGCTARRRRVPEAAARAAPIRAGRRPRALPGRDRAAAGTRCDRRRRHAMTETAGQPGLPANGRAGAGGAQPDQAVLGAARRGRWLAGPPCTRWRTCRSRCALGRSPRSSARAGPGSPRWRGCWPGSSPRPRANCCSTGSTVPLGQRHRQQYAAPGPAGVAGPVRLAEPGALASATTWSGR